MSHFSIDERRRHIRRMHNRYDSRRHDMRQDRDLRIIEAGFISALLLSATFFFISYSRRPE